VKDHPQARSFSEDSHDEPKPLKPQKQSNNWTIYAMDIKYHSL